MAQLVHVEAKRFVCRMRGGSQPILIQADDDEFYVVKFFVNMQGPLVVINEVLASAMYRDARLPVPEWRIVKISDKFLNANRDAWFQFRDQQMRPAAGCAFGSRLVGSGDRRCVWELLPGNMQAEVKNRSQFWSALAIDVLFGQTDLRQAVFFRTQEGSLEAKFIDFGSDYRLPKAWNDSQRVLACRYADMRVYPKLSPEIVDEIHAALARINVKSLESAFSSLPFAWKRDGEIERYLEVAATVASEDSRSKAASLVIASDVGGGPIDTPVDKLRDNWNRHFAFQYMSA